MKHLIFTVIVLMFSQASYAKDPHHDHDRYHDYEHNHEINNTVLVSQPTLKVSSEGIAMGVAAAQAHLDAGTLRTQVAVGIGNYDGNNAAVVSIGKRKCSDCALLNGTIGLEKDKIGLGFGASWRIK